MMDGIGDEVPCAIGLSSITHIDLASVAVNMRIARRVLVKAEFMARALRRAPGGHQHSGHRCHIGRGQVCTSCAPQWECSM